jgi:hypothetical protein
MQTKTLFSQHYLHNRLPDHPEWAEDPRPALRELRALWARAAEHGETWNEAQTEAEFVRPALEVLGWSYIVQASSRRAGQVTRPDYALFADAAARDAAYPLQGDDDAFYGRALAVGEAKHWGRRLSHKDSSGRDAWQAAGNPSHQMVSYLVGTRAPWGILTNGRVWRLYSREVSSTASQFYEVDLGLLFDFLPPGVEPDDAQIEQFKRWWLFFRRDAFVPDPGGRAFLERVHDGSATYARRISDKLKELVYAEVMPEIAGGFVAYRYHQLGIRQETDESLRQVYQASLSLLYKLLFLLYAEARGLLPMDNPGYREGSLSLVARWAADRLDRGLPLSDATYAASRYEALLALFHRVDRGDPRLGVPRYNGGLFNPEQADNRFLEAHKLSDRAVARAVDILVRDAGEPVDYAYIGVRNLGAIYEGLLENRLRVADAAAGRVELVDDRGERKASGSYYTPDYIVAYIVEHTLAPVLDEREAAFRAAMDRCAGLRRRLRTREADKRDANRRLHAELEQAERDAREAFLGVKVLDPSMGSGHFLVNAVDYLTDQVILRMQTYHDAHPEIPWDWNPIQRLIEAVRSDILAELERQGIRLEPERLDDTALLTRLVMKRCIYGVDLNPMAVELAKLSLWLHSFTIGAPLSFLDHHLRWGNSLIGAGVQTVERAIQASEQGGAVQLGLFAGPFAGLLDLTGLMIEVAEQADATLADVRHSAETFERFQEALVPYKRVLDLWVSQHFAAQGGTRANDKARELLTVHGGDVLPALRGEIALSEDYAAAIERARALWREKRFFHWDLEFPEVFVDLRRRDWAGNPGFDAVIGNPPYVRQEELTPLKGYLKVQYSHIYQGTADLFIYFFGRGLQLLRQGGLLSYISSNSWLRVNYAKRLRAYLRDEMTVETIVDLGDNRVFADAPDVYPAIPLVRREKPPEDHVAQVAAFSRGEGIHQFEEQLAERLFSVSIHNQPDTGWQLEDDSVRRLFEKLMNLGEPLESTIENQIYRGILTGLNEAFLIDQATRDYLSQSDPGCEPLVKPLVNGADVRSWYVEDRGRWLILLPDKWTESTFGSGLSEAEAWDKLRGKHPGIAAHLAPFAEAARKRADQGSYWWELRPCTYYGEFEGYKIFYPELSKTPRFALADPGSVGNKTTFMIPGKRLALLGLLMSRVLWFAATRLCVPIGERKDMLRYTLSAQFMSQLPIPEMTETQRATVSDLAAQITEHSRVRYDLHRRVCHRITIDLGQSGSGLSQKLAAWWNLEFRAFRSEIRKAFKHDIPLDDRGDWEAYLAAQQSAYRQLTSTIIQLETQLNAQVYSLFDLNPKEIGIIEEATKYAYGEM